MTAEQKPQALTLTVPNDTIEQGIVTQVSTDLDIDADRVTVTRITRKRGGGVTADVSIAPEKSAEQ